VVPDANYFPARKTIEDERLAKLQESLTETETERLRSESAALLERQRQPVNNDVLPRIRPQDVNPLPRPAFALPEKNSGLIAASIPTNGVSYARVLYDVSNLNDADWPWLQLYAEVVPEIGVGDKSYEEADAWRHREVAFFDVNLHGAQTQDAARSLRLHVDFYAKGLREEKQPVADLLSRSISAPRFDEYERLAFLIDSNMQDKLNALADEGDDYARLAAVAPLSPLRKFEDYSRGTSSLAFYRDLHEKSQSDDGLREISEQLMQLHQRIVSSARTVVTAGLEQDSHELAGMLDLPPPSPQAPAKEPAPPAEERALSNVALHATAQVNHCFAAWAAPTVNHPDAPVLAVLGELLTNLVLHQALREEGGAYGGNAGYSPSAGAFAMMSYRDPRLAATYKDFERSISSLMDTELKQENIEEAIICVIQELDKPRTPFGEVMWAWDQQQQGITEEMRRRYRQGVLQCTAQDIKAAAAKWLLNKPYSRAAFVGNTTQDLAGLELSDLEKLAG
jgi:Zn-dependent M16 (insulinase) family peptidase